MVRYPVCGFKELVLLVVNVDTDLSKVDLLFTAEFNALEPPEVRRNDKVQGVV